MSPYEPTIRDRVRIALALTIIQDKKNDEDLETCILRFRDHFPQIHQRHQLRRPLRLSTVQNQLHDDNHDNEYYHSQRERWQAKTRAMQAQIDSLTKQLADREADVSMLQTDLEAVQPAMTSTGTGASKAPPRKKQKKPGPLANESSNVASNVDVTEREGDIGSEGVGSGAGSGAGAGATSGKKRPGKVGASQAKAAGVGTGQVQGEGEGHDGVFFMLSRRLDEVLEQATGESSRTARLLSKLFDAPQDITHHFLPLRLQAICLHANDLVQTCSTYLEASIEAALHPSTAQVKQGISARIQFPGKMVQTIALLLQEFLPLLSKAVGEIFSEIEHLPGFDHAEFKTRWSDLKIAIGAGVIMPSIKAIKKTSDKVWAENQARLLSARGSRTRFMSQAIGQAEANQRDLREGLVKLLLTLSRCQMAALTTKNATTGNTEDGLEHPLAEMVAFGTNNELIEILQPGPNSAAIRPRVITSGSNPHTHLGFGASRTEEISADQETVHVLLVILRTSIPYLPCYASNGIGTIETRSDYLVEKFLKRQIEPEGIPPHQKTGVKISVPSPPGLLLGMTIRSQLVQLLSPIIQPITSALYDCFSSYKPTAQRDVSISALLQEDRALKDALMQVAEELMLAEGEEQGAIAEWVIGEIEQGGISPNEMNTKGGAEEREKVRGEGDGLMDTGHVVHGEERKKIQQTTGQAKGNEVDTTAKPPQELSTVISPNALPSVVDQPGNVPAPETEAIPKQVDIVMDIAAREELSDPTNGANDNAEAPQSITLQNSPKVREEPEHLPTLHDSVRTVRTPVIASCYNEDPSSPPAKILLGRDSTPMMIPPALQQPLSTSSSSNQSPEAILETTKPSTPIAQQPVLPITPENSSMEKVQTPQLVDTSFVVNTSVSDYCSLPAKLLDGIASLSDLQIASGLNTSSVADRGVGPSVLHPSGTQAHTQ
ncbi:hypothetical protein HD553DRAFT_350411 [Filobasidium floriforme]|uniref:uncharacterized protein n=1 Tax=Filobasidium floriforme TaxID=5210 RepID=UPI001E8DABE6|nr:uncharacterized protein HD553DRAFT_350411 [Filobasidium floriforme]KAH8084186.1 hypothetical protein HD553DRAFT_350411 [Filobasidium floriforme]